MNTLTRNFWSLERAFPTIRTRLWRTFYNLVVWLVPDRDLHFMNWGYRALNYTEETRDIGDLSPLSRNVTRLYAHTLGAVAVSGKRVVEIGSGRGGGAAWVARTQQPLSVVGIELSPAAVRLASDVHQGISGLRFEVGNALALPFADCSVDTLMNVESCHHYADLPLFLREVGRVLVVDGYLCLSDYREAHEMPGMRSDLAACGLELVRFCDITANVVAALDEDNAAKEVFLNSRFSWPLRPIMRTFFGNHGTDVYNGFANRTWLYHSWVLRKCETVKATS